MKSRRPATLEFLIQQSYKTVKTTVMVILVLEQHYK